MNSMHPLRTLFACALLAAFLAVPTRAQDAPNPDEGVRRVENRYVCMVNDRYFKDIQIPVPIGEKTYYGCCQGCVTTLKNDPTSRMATDPVSGTKVHKATAVAGALPDGTVRYFESEDNLNTFARTYEEKDE